MLQFLKPVHFDIPERALNQTATELAAQGMYCVKGTLSIYIILLYPDDRA